MLRIFLERFLLGPCGLASEGLTIKVGDEHRVLFCRPTNLLSDGDGLRIGLDWKGAASMKPCFKHFNVLKLGSGLADRRPGFVEISCTDARRFRPWQSDQVYVAAESLVEANRRVEAGTMTRAKYDDLQMSLGLNFNPWGLLLSESLRSADRPRCGGVLSCRSHATAQQHSSPPIECPWFSEAVVGE